MPFAVATGAVALAAVAAAVHPKTSSSGSPVLRPAVAASGATVHAAPHAARVVVYVAGEVRRPGVYGMEAGSRVQAALQAAGGALDDADLLAVNLAEPLTDGEKIVLPAKGVVSVQDEMAQGPAASAVAASSRPSHRHARTTSAAGRRHKRAHKAPPAQPIDLNSADETQLEQLPGIGPSLASRIVTYRDLNGPYRSADELLDVAGMTDRRLSDIDPYIVVR